MAGHLMQRQQTEIRKNVWYSIPDSLLREWNVQKRQQTEFSPLTIKFTEENTDQIQPFENEMFRGETEFSPLKMKYTEDKTNQIQPLENEVYRGESRPNSAL